MSELTFGVVHLFGGSGGGAIGFQRERARLLSHELRFRCLGSVDIDEVANADFRRFTGAPTLCADIETLTGAELRAFCDRPDVMFCSAPCKGGSRLLSNEKAKTEKYERMNRLALHGARAVLEAWPDDPPALLLFENVPGLVARAKGMLRDLRRLLRSHGYVLNESTHDCGEIGGLAQHRDRWLLVARRPQRCPQLLYQPQRKRVRACGEVLSELPVPATPAAHAWGVLHELPRLSWTNWLRLALIPAGGDWRDLEGVLAGRARREVFRRHAIAKWRAPIETITGPGGHSVEAIDDPRVDEIVCAPRNGNWGTYGVLPWDTSAGTVAGESSPSNGRFSVADPRVAVAPGVHNGAYGVRPWDEPAPTLSGGADHPSRGRFAVGDPRLAQLELGHSPGRSGPYGVEAWDAPSKTIAGASKIDNRPVSIADPRIDHLPFGEAAGRHENKYRIERWDRAAHTVIGKLQPGSGRPSIADPRLATLGYGLRRPRAHVDRVHGADGPVHTITTSPAPSSGRPAIADDRLAELRVPTAYDAGYGVLRMDQPARTVAGTVATGTGAYAVADGRERTDQREVRILSLDEALALDLPGKKPPPFLPVIVAEDGTWHRPLTLLELAALQGYPLELRGERLRFGGTRTQIATHVGNSVPPPAGGGIARQMLLTLGYSALGGFALSGDLPVWVVPDEHEAAHA